MMQVSIAPPCDVEQATEKGAFPFKGEPVA
jgi:hypothetical protein